MEQLGYTRAQVDRSVLAADGDAPLTFIASTEVVNRKGYYLRHEGWRLDNFNANPVMLWMHDPYSPSLATGQAVSKSKQVLIEDVVFDREDEFARQVESKYRRGFLNAVSVGWRGMDDEGAYVDLWGIGDDEIGEKLFYDLVETSFVTTPGNPQAVRKQHHLALSKISRELAGLFDEQERGEATADEIDAAVRESLGRLGLDVDALAKLAAPAAPPNDDAPVGVDPHAARAVLAAFNREGNLQ